MLYNLMKYIRYTIQMYHVKKIILIIYIGMCTYGMSSPRLASSIAWGNPSRSSLVPIYILNKFTYVFLVQIVHIFSL